MAAELPEAGMAAKLPVPELGMVAVYIAIGCAKILKPLLDFLGGANARSPVLDAAAAVVIVTVPVAYLAVVTLPHVAPAALGQFAVLVSALLLFMAFIFFLAAGVR